MNRIVNKIKKSILSVFIALTTASSIVVPMTTTPVAAASGLDINTAFDQVIGREYRNDWHWSVNGGSIIQDMLNGTTTQEQVYNTGLDCTAGTVAVVSRAVRNAGADPWKYFGRAVGQLNRVGSNELPAYFDNMTLVYQGKDITADMLEPGDILVWGSKHI